MNLIPEIEFDQGLGLSLRHHLHAHPELGYEVHQTSAFVAANLRKWGIEVTEGVGRTGLVGTLRSGASRHAIGLRADMDALPIEEINTFAYRSKTPGVMHACGHDGHTAMLLAAAHYLSKHRNFDGIVQFIFQPAEEGGAGAAEMIKDGLFERFAVDAVFGVHNWPGLPAGSIGLRTGAVMASSNRFKLVIEGTGCHAAMPHVGSDALLASAQIVTALQSIISRNTDPLDSAVLSVTQIHAGDSDNVVANQAILRGTVRTFAEATTDLIEEKMRTIASSIAQALGCSARLEFMRKYPPTVNTAPEVDFATEVAASVVGEENLLRNVTPTMASEDFSFMLRERPGCYAFIGNGDGAHRGHGHGHGPCELHNASYDFNDALLPIGASYFVRMVERFLPRNKGVTAIMRVRRAEQEHDQDQEKQ